MISDLEAVEFGVGNGERMTFWRWEGQATAFCQAVLLQDVLGEAAWTTANFRARSSLNTSDNVTL